MNTGQEDTMTSSNTGKSGSLAVKLWRGERMCLVGMDVTDPEDDFVGFAIEVKSPGSGDYVPLRNRLNFAYAQADSPGVNGFRNYLSTAAPFQKFRWIHFPYDPRDGQYRYRVTKMHMDRAGKLRNGDRVALPISLEQVTYDKYLDVGFTRNFASSQAYAEKFGGNPDVIPADPGQGLDFHKLPGDVYRWLGFEAYDLIFGVLDEVAKDRTLSIDVFAYDFNEPDILARLKACGKRVRAIIDNSASHGKADSAESKAAKCLVDSKGAGSGPAHALQVITAQQGPDRPQERATGQGAVGLHQLQLGRRGRGTHTRNDSRAPGRAGVFGH
jgi:hypothetical protein